MMRIAVDAMGGDLAPRAVVHGAVAAALEQDISLLLVGPRALLEAELAACPAADRRRIAVLDAPDVIAMDEPASAIRRRPLASVRVAAEAVARGDALALFTAGHSGAAVLAAHHAFGVLDGIDRPALAATIPTREHVAVLVDAGASLTCRAEHLV
ncbi:MAG: phosphate acyltransferase, partial [Acidobacteria bacterium]|nr:phosphate acyltransferase [Acidobacteriota bacterium]